MHSTPLCHGGYLNALKEKMTVIPQELIRYQTYEGYCMQYEIIWFTVLI